MNEEQSKKQLEKEGFTNVYVWNDGPNIFYPNHTHSKITAHIILKGEMKVIMKNKTEKYKEGQRFDVPANSAHSAKTGPKGCNYVVGEK